jgi:hypothetical protein
MTHGAVRWKIRRLATRGWMCGTNWIADAPVPITATSRPVRSWSWSHLAEWNAVPRNDGRPGTSGIDGSLSGPVAATNTSAVYSPCEVSMCQRRCASSHRAARTSWSKRRCGSTPKRTAHRRRYSQISGCGENERLHRGLRANEKE